MFEDILNAANRYDQGLTRVHSRQDQWLASHERVRDHLTAIANYLNTNARYKQGFFVDTLLAFNEGMRGTSTRMPSVEFRSGAMPMPVTFRNSIGEKKTYEEEGFTISFRPVITGQIIVLLEPHYSDLNVEEPEPVNLAIIHEPAHLSNEMIENIVTKGMQIAYYSSFTGIAEQNESTGEETATPIKRNPIGFKRHDTTEKI
jgi:hypothetical protein